MMDGCMVHRGGLVSEYLDTVVMSECYMLIHRCWLAFFQPESASFIAASRSCMISSL
jgi:hypothetical protein